MRARATMGKRLRRLVSASLMTLAATAAAAPVGAQTLSGVATLSADQVHVDAAGRLVASGAVEVWYGSTRLTARRVVYDQRSGHLSVEGPIVLSDGPDRVFLADSAELSSDLRDGLIRSARLVLDQQLQIAAASIERSDANRTQLNAVVASSCPVCAANPTPLWEIRAARVTHDQAEQQLYFERAQFRLSGVPIFYAPYLRLPDPTLRRARGFLVPRVRFNTQFGIGVALPYFLPFGPARDLTLTPMVTSLGSLSMGLRYRQAMANGGFELGGQVSTDQTSPGQARGYAYFRALLGLRNDFRLSADLLAAGDRRYLDDYGISGDSRIRSHVTVERIRRDEMIRARAVAFRTLTAGVDNSVLPNQLAQVDWERRIDTSATPFGGAARLEFGAQVVHRESSVDGDDGRDLARLNMLAEWRRQAILPGGIVATGAVQGRIDAVRIADDSRYPDPVTRASAEAMLDLRWPWARGDGQGGGHVIEPVVQIIGSRRHRVALPNEDNRMPELDRGNLFAFRRYAGNDAVDDGSRINAGLRWTHFDPDGWSTEAMIGRIWRRDGYDGFDPANPQPLGQTRSDWLIAGQLRTPLGATFGLRLLFDESHDLRRGETSLDWSNATTSLSATYMYLPANPFEGRTINQTEFYIDASREFESGWSGRIGWDFDALNREIRAGRAGLVYRGDCLAVDLSLSHRFATSTSVSESTTIGLRVDLLGIGGAPATSTGAACRT